MEYLKSTLTATEKEVVKSVVLGTGNPAPEKIDDDEYEELFGEVLGAEMQAMKRQPITARQREILQEEVKHYKGGVEGLAKNLHCHPDQLKAALGDPVPIDRLITSTIDNMQFISEVIDRYEKYAPAVESFDKIASKKDITAWIDKADKMVGNDIDDPLRKAATSLMRLNEDHYSLFLGSMEEFRKDPMLLARMYVNAARANMQDLSKNPFKDVAVTIIDADRKEMSVSLIGLDDSEHKMRVVDGMIQGGELTFANGDIVDLDYMEGHTISDELGVPLATKIKEMTYSGHIYEPELARGAGMWDYYAEYIGDLLEKNVNGKLDILLPENGDKMVLDKPFAIENAQGLKEGARIEVSEIHHVFSVDNDKDAYLCGDERGGVSTDRLYISDLQRLKTVLDEKKYTVQLSAQGQHAGLDDVLLRANVLGIEFHPVGLKCDITVSDFDDGIDISEKTFQYASVENDDIIVYENLYDVFEFNKGFSLSELPESSQASVLDRLYDSFFAENDQMVVVYDKQEVPSYALGAIINGDLSGIEDPEDEQNIRDFMDKNAGYLYEIQPDSEGFTRNPAFGLPTDCETVFMVKPITPKELLEQKKVETHETLDVDKNKPYTITIGTDNRPGGVEGEYHLQFKPDIMNVTFCEQEEVAKEFGGTMRVFADGQEWADFYHEADAVKFAEKIIGMNQERESVDKTEDLKSVLDDNFLMGEEVGKRIYFTQPISFGNEAGSWRAVAVHCGSKNYEIEDNEGNKIPYGIFGRYDQIASAVKEAVKAPMEHQDFKFGIGRNNYDIHISSLDGREGFVAMMSLSGDKNLLADPIVMDEDVSRVYLDVKDNTDAAVRAKFAETVADRHFGDLLRSLRHQEEIVAGYREAGLLDKPIDLVKPVVYDTQMSDKVAEVSDSGIHTCVALYKDLDDAKEHFEPSFFLDQGSKAYSQAMYDSLKETLAVHLEQNAKQAIHDRIVTPSARSFNSEQVEVLNRYHQIATPETPASEVFSRLLHEVSQEPDVAHKPEKWVTDVAKELDGLAEGITREHGQGLKR